MAQIQSQKKNTACTNCIANVTVAYMVIINFITFVVGICLLAASSYVLANIGDWSAYVSQTGAIMGVVTSLVITALSIMGCCGAVQRNKWILSFYLFFLFIIAFLLLGVAIAVMVYGKQLCGGKAGVGDEARCQEYLPARELNNAISKIYNDCCEVTDPTKQLPECPNPGTEPSPLYSCVYPRCIGTENELNPGCVRFFVAGPDSPATAMIEKTPDSVCLAIKTLIFKEPVQTNTFIPEVWEGKNEPICMNNNAAKTREQGIDWMQKVATFLEERMGQAGAGMVALAVIVCVLWLSGLFLVCRDSTGAGSSDEHQAANHLSKRQIVYDTGGPITA
jgi:hypothetical protein